MKRLLILSKMQGRKVENFYWLRRPCGHLRGVRDKHNNEPCMACIQEDFETEEYFLAKLDDNPDYRRTQ